MENGGDARARNPWLLLIGVTTALAGTALAFYSGGGLWFIPVVAGLVGLAAGLVPRPPRAHKRWAAVALVAIPILTVVMFGLNEYSNRPQRPVWVVLPKGYSGEFSIVKDVRHGRPLVLKDGAWVFTIPPNGVLRVEDTWPFFVGHRGGVVYEDGTRARVEDLGASTGPIPAGTGGTHSNRDDGSRLSWRVVSSP
jgi:hypothetical protein